MTEDRCFSTPQQRYLEDTSFSLLVRRFEVVLREGQFSYTDLCDACNLAIERDERSKMERMKNDSM